MEFCCIFFLAGVYVLVVSLIFGQKSIPAVLSVAPFGISLVVSIIAGFATFKGTDLFFSIDNDKNRVQVWNDQTCDTLIQMD